MEKQPKHTLNLPRLNCVSGQIDGIKKMILAERNCTDIITQIRAVRAVLKQVETNILETHLRDCIAQSFQNNIDKEAKINELSKLLIKYND